MKVTIMWKTGLRALDLNRRKAIREKCLNCSSWSTREVTNCKFSDCALHLYREGTGKQDPKDRQRAIQGYCFWCMAGQRVEVAKCTSVHCALFGFRRGKAEKAIPMLKKAHGEAFFKAKSLE